MKGVLCITFISFVSSTSTFTNPSAPGNSWGPCSDAVNAIITQGDGTTPGSCLSCDPTTNKCAPKCQALIDTFYRACDGVYTPPDYYFDPAQSISGFWADCKDRLRIAAQRCGCNKGNSIGGVSFVVVLFAIWIGCLAS